MELSEKCRRLLLQWRANEQGEGLFRLTGPYWEVLYPILLKYAPNQLHAYENLIMEEFEVFNDDVKEVVDVGNEEKNYRNAIKYMNAREDMYATPLDPHYITIKNGDELEYIPNRWAQD